ncbi:MAG: hypothetical protein M1818_006539 [Claussenomyces sp. TS43310]|nr:MAG: hypothetical protein M1818_006539 [Claussenomyces sp. TS43310]
MDHGRAPSGKGRELHHINAIDAAQTAGVQHIYYTSLALGSKSKAGVMQAHLRTEAYLAGLQGINFTVIREGLYNESWLLYFGFYKLRVDDRHEIVVAGDGPINWTSLPDLGYVNAVVLAAPSTDYAGRTVTLSTLTGTTLNDLAKSVSNIRGKDIKLNVVAPDEYYRIHTERGEDEGHVEW